MMFADDDAFVLHEEAGPHLWFLILNAKEPPFDDVRGKWFAMRLVVVQMLLAVDVDVVEPYVGRAIRRQR